MKNYFEMKAQWRKERRQARRLQIFFLSLVILTISAEAVAQIRERAEAHVADNSTTIVESVTGHGVGRDPAKIIEQPIFYPPEDNTPKNAVLRACSEDELEELSILAYLEAGAESEQCIRYVVEAIFNQLNFGAWGETLHEVIWSAGNFEPAYMIPYSETTDAIRTIVRDVYENGISLPARIMFFRADHYHTWNGAIPEFTIENVYFSSSIWCK